MTDHTDQPLSATAFEPAPTATETIATEKTSGGQPRWVMIGLALAVVLLLFGGRGKISAIMGDFGKGLRNFKTGLKGPEGDDSEAEAIEDVAQPAPKKAAPKKAAAKKKAPAKKAGAKKATRK